MLRIIESLALFFLSIYFFTSVEKPIGKSSTLTDNKPTQGKKKKLGIVFLVLSVVLFFSGTMELDRSVQAERNQFIEQAVTSIKAGLPRKVNDDTTLTRVRFEKDTIKLYHEVTGVNFEDVDENKFQQDFSERTVDLLREKEDVKYFLKYKINFAYIFHIEGSHKSIYIFIDHSKLAEPNEQ